MTQSLLAANSYWAGCPLLRCSAPGPGHSLMLGPARPLRHWAGRGQRPATCIYIYMKLYILTFSAQADSDCIPALGDTHGSRQQSGLPARWLGYLIVWSQVTFFLAVPGNWLSNIQLSPGEKRIEWINGIRSSNCQILCSRKMHSLQRPGILSRF